MNELSLPIQILKFEAADLAAAKAADGQQGKDGFAGFGSRVHGGQIIFSAPMNADERGICVYPRNSAIYFSFTAKYIMSFL